MRTEEEWRTFLKGMKQSVDGAKTIGAVNAIEQHNDVLLRELKKVSPNFYDHLAEYADKRRLEIVNTTEKGSVK